MIQKKYRNLLLFLLSVLLYTSILAQVQSKKIYSNYNNKNILFTSTIYKSVKDKSGNIWFATSNGLLMYNGINFEEIKILGRDQDVINIIQVDDYFVLSTFSYDMILLDPITRKQKLLQLNFGVQNKNFIRHTLNKNGKLYWWIDSIHCFIIPKKQFHIDSLLDFNQSQLNLKTFLKTYHNNEVLFEYLITISNDEIIVKDSVLVYKNKVFRIVNNTFIEYYLPEINSKNITTINFLDGSFFIGYSDGKGLLKYNLDAQNHCNGIDTIFKNDFITDFVHRNDDDWISTYRQGVFQVNVLNNNSFFQRSPDEVLFVKKWNNNTVIVTSKSLLVFNGNQIINSAQIHNFRISKVYDIIQHKDTFFIVGNSKILKVSNSKAIEFTKAGIVNIKDVSYTKDKIIFREKNSNVIYENAVFYRKELNFEPSILSTAVALKDEHNIFYGTSSGLYWNDKRVAETDSNRVLKMRLNGDFLLLNSQNESYLYNIKQKKSTLLKSLEKKKIVATAILNHHFAIVTDNEIFLLNCTTLATDYYFNTKYFDNELVINNISTNENQLYIACNKGFFSIDVNNRVSKIAPKIFISYDDKFLQMKEDVVLKIPQKKQIKYHLQFSNTNMNTFCNDYMFQVFNSSNDLIIENYDIAQLNQQFYNLPSSNYNIVISEKNTGNIIEKSRFEILPFWYQTNFFKGFSILLALLFSAWLSVFFINRKHKIKLKENKQKLELIQSQIKSNTLQLNAHLIFNLLNPLNYFIVTNKNNDALSYLKSFTKFIRLLFNKTSHEYHSVSDFIEFMNAHIQIQQLRFDSHFQYEIRNDLSNSFEVKIPILIVMPMVENAIEHGILPYFQKKQNNNSNALEIIISNTENAIEINIFNITIAENISFEKTGHSLEVVKKHLQLLKNIYGTGEIQFNILNSQVQTKIILPSNLNNKNENTYN